MDKFTRDLIRTYNMIPSHVWELKKQLDFIDKVYPPHLREIQKQIDNFKKLIPDINILLNNSVLVEEEFQDSIDEEYDLEVSFDVSKGADENPIIIVSQFFEKKLLEYYRDNPEEICHIDRRKFEELVAELFNGFGYDVELTKRTRDGGKDIIAIKHTHINEKFLIECKEQA